MIILQALLGFAIAIGIGVAVAWKVLSKRKPRQPVEKLPRSKPPSLDRSIYTVQQMVHKNVPVDFYVPAVAVSLIKKGYIVKEGDKWRISEGKEPLKPDEKQILEKLKKRVSGEFDLKKIWKVAVRVKRRSRISRREANVDVDLDPEVGSLKPFQDSLNLVGSLALLGFVLVFVSFVLATFFPDWAGFWMGLGFGIALWWLILVPGLLILLFLKAEEWVGWTEKGWREKFEWEAYKDYLFLSQPEVDADELPYAIALGAGDVVKPKDERAKELYEAYKEVR